KRTSGGAVQMSAFDPKRTSRSNRCRFYRLLLVASLYLVADFLGDHSVADMEVVQQSHLHLSAYGKWAILEAIAGDAKRHPHVIKYAVGCGETLDRLKGDPLCGVKHAQIHLLDHLPASVGYVAGGRLPDGILCIKLDAFVDTVGIFLMQMHVDQVERIFALFLICLRQAATSKELLNRLSRFFDDIHDLSPVSACTTNSAGQDRPMASYVSMRAKRP